MGELVITFLGPSPTDFLTRKALDILGMYLTSSAAAPLNKEYVEIESPLWYVVKGVGEYSCSYNMIFCSSYIYFAEDTRATHVNLPIYVTSVPTEHLDTFNEKLEVSLQQIANNGIDMQRMEMVINRDERQAWFYQG